MDEALDGGRWTEADGSLHDVEAVLARLRVNLTAASVEGVVRAERNLQVMRTELQALAEEQARESVSALLQLAEEIGSAAESQV